MISWPNASLHEADRSAAINAAFQLGFCTFVLSNYMKTVPKEINEAAIVDGATVWKTYRSVILPLTRPAIATVGVFSMIPIWNDLWFPLILAPGESTQTITLGVQDHTGRVLEPLSELAPELLPEGWRRTIDGRVTPVGRPRSYASAKTASVLVLLSGSVMKPS